MQSRVLLLLVMVAFFGGCLVMEHPYSKLPPGPWRGVLKLDLKKDFIERQERETSVHLALEFEEVTQGELPFNFDIVYSQPDSLIFEISNGSQKLRITDIDFSHDANTNKDTVLIRFPASDNQLKAIFEDNVMEGHFTSSDAGTIPFVAHHGRQHRFTLLKKKAVLDLSGTWQMELGIDSADTDSGSIKFMHNDHKLLASFSSASRSFENLEGTVQDNKLYLSFFDGSSVFLLEGMIRSDQSLEGVLRYGTRHYTTWRATMEK